MRPPLLALDPHRLPIRPRSGQARKTSRRGSGAVIKAGARVREHRLDNGLRVLIAERHADPVVAAVLFYPAGVRTELPHEAGVSHFLEHMMFKGTRKLGKGEVDRLTTRLGGQNNAFTGYDHTAYWFEFASDRWEHALDVEADRMQHLALDPTEFDAERAVVLEELSMGEDEPWRVLGRRVEELLFPHHPYGRPIIGFPETLRAMSPGLMRDYYGRFYHPGNATLVVCGDVRPGPALKAVETRFGRIRPGPVLAEIDPVRRPPEEPGGERRVSMQWDDAAHRLMIAWPTVPVRSNDDDVLDVLMTVLAGGRLSRLWRRLVTDEGLATSISASNDTRVEAGVLWIYAECAQGVAPEALERAVHEEVARLVERPVPAGELARAKAILVSGEAFDGETVTDVAEELGEWAVDDDWRRAFDGGAAIRRITARRVRDVAQRYLRPERRVVGWCHPKVETGRTKAVKKKGTRKRASTRRKAARGKRKAS